MTVTADDLHAAISAVVSTLRPVTGRDWPAQAGALEWDWWWVGDHQPRRAEGAIQVSCYRPVVPGELIPGPGRLVMMT
jgi:hypothetical protein